MTVSLRRGQRPERHVERHTELRRDVPGQPAAALFHDSTAPSSMDLSGSGTSASRSTSERTPIPPQAGQAPNELNANNSALGCSKWTPHVGQTSSTPWVAIDGGTWWPFGQRCEPAATSSAAPR